MCKTSGSEGHGFSVRGPGSTPEGDWSGLTSPSMNEGPGGALKVPGRRKGTFPGFGWLMTWKNRE